MSPGETRTGGGDGRRKARGFTLVELMVVVALIAGLAAFLLGGIGDGGKSAALRAAQVTLANLVAAARTHAMARGQPARLLVHIDPASRRAVNRFLGYMAIQSFDGAGWNTVGEAQLPAGVYVVPRDPLAFAGLLPAAVAWTRPSDGGMLRSSALRANSSSFPDAEVSAAVAAPEVEKWAVIAFSPSGTTANSGDLVLASGRRVPGGDGVPVQFESPDEVSGLTISSYGVTALMNGRESF